MWSTGDDGGSDIGGWWYPLTRGAHVLHGTVPGVEWGLPVGVASGSTGTSGHPSAHKPLVRPE